MAVNNGKLTYICNDCGYEINKWVGKCPECNSWNSFVERNITKSAANKKSSINVSKQVDIEDYKLSSINTSCDDRIITGFVEFDRVLGGGIVKGSVVLLSGSPGVGKSTLLLQICEYISKQHTVFYFSGEESEKQIKLRANRLSVQSNDIYIISQNDVCSIIDIIEHSLPGFVIIDSIQTIKMTDVSSAAGSIVQVKECTELLIHLAKRLAIPIIIVGHVNKDGGIAGPKVLEHMVDTVLYLEGEKYNNYKILTTKKNRFGSTNEIGIFDMQSSGLVEIINPSAALISDRKEMISGTAVVCIMEGSRPIFVEVQALVTKSDFAVPRRTSTGFDYNRVCLILAILEKRCGYSFGKLDVYINVVGGLKIDDPSADLAIAMAICSSVRDMAIKNDTVIIGEIGLTGEIRDISSIMERIHESIKLGFKKCIIPKHSLKKLEKNLDVQSIKDKIDITCVELIPDVLREVFK